MRGRTGRALSATLRLYLMALLLYFGRLKCRLVAVPAPPLLALARESERHQQEHNKSSNPGPQARTRDTATLKTASRPAFARPLPCLRYRPTACSKHETPVVAAAAAESTRHWCSRARQALLRARDTAPLSLPDTRHLHPLSGSNGPRTWSGSNGPRTCSGAKWHAHPPPRCSAHPRTRGPISRPGPGTREHLLALVGQAPPLCACVG